MGTRLGIVFTGGEGPAPQTLRRFFDTLPGRVTAAADSGLILAEAAGLKPDWIVGDMDSLDSKLSTDSRLSIENKLSADERLHRYPPERVIRYPAEKDYTDTELAFNLLREKGCGEIWIVGGGGGRLDHLFGIRDLFERNVCPRRWITASEDIYCIDGSGYPNCLKMRIGQAASGGAVTSDNLVSVFPLGGGPWKAESRGLKWPLDNVYWERGLYGLSNVAVAEEIAINAVQGRFMVIFPGLEEELCRL